MAELDAHNELSVAVCALICRSDGIKAREIGERLGIPRSEVNRLLYSSPLLHELCWQDREYRWHGIVRQERPHGQLSEFAGYYSDVRAFMGLDAGSWLEKLREGCVNIGRSLSDTRGLTHSFLDCRETVRRLVEDMLRMEGESCLDWELAFELRLRCGRRVRIYADVLVITRDRVFSLEFKMKDRVDPAEVVQAAKYTPYLEILFGPDYDVVPVLVLTGARDLFEYVPIGDMDAVLPAVSGDMLFNVFNEYLGFLRD